MTSIRRRAARIGSVSVLILAVLSTFAAGVLAVVLHGEVPEGRSSSSAILSTPGMREGLAELERRAAEGDALAVVGGDVNVGFVAILVALLVWTAVGAFIVWRQPANWAGWLLIVTGAPSRCSRSRSSWSSTA